MKFTTPCFVRVDDAEKQDELISWCAMIGYSTKDVYWVDSFAHYVFAENDFAGRCKKETLADLIAQGAIDCCANIERFKALAALTTYCDREQWFTDGQDWQLCHDQWWFLPDEIATKKVIPSTSYHKATVKEIIKYFKKYRDSRKISK